MTHLISIDTNVSDPAAATPNAPAAIEIFDPPMCCPTGLCGPTLDQTLMEVGDMIQTLRSEGLHVARYQLTSHPHRFMNNPDVLSLVRARQAAALPITTVGGHIIKVGSYPTLAEVRTYLEGIEHA